MEKDEIYKEIADYEKKIRELRGKLIETKRFKHVCPHCKSEWYGWKEVITECTFCKARMQVVKVDLTGCEEACARFDELIKERGVITKEQNSNPKKVWTFRAVKDGIEFITMEGGVKVQHVVVPRSYDVLKDMIWQEFVG